MKKDIETKTREINNDSSLNNTDKNNNNRSNFKHQRKKLKKKCQKQWIILDKSENVKYKAINKSQFIDLRKTHNANTLIQTDGTANRLTVFYVSVAQ